MFLRTWHDFGRIPVRTGDYARTLARTRINISPSMHHFHRMILRMLPGPMFGWLGMLMFLLVMQFLIKYLPDLVGKGLPLLVIAELIIYNLAYMLVLAVPMAVLIATLMTFGRIAENGSYAVIKGAGVSFPQLIWPVLIVGAMLTGTMGYFNNIVLPEANFRARNLWQDIRLARPGFQLREGVFYDGIGDYRILVKELPPDQPNELRDITIYDYSDGPNYRTDIKAATGNIRTVAGGEALELLLFDGEVHRRNPPGSGDRDSYQRLSFKRHRLRVALGNLNFERTDPSEGRRTDRTMRTADMVRLVDSLDANAEAESAVVSGLLASLGGRGPDDSQPGRGRLPAPESDKSVRPSPRLALAGLDSLTQRSVYEYALQDARSVRTRLESARRTVDWATQRADRYRVEVHKKYSIALACLIFMLIGAPLGLSIRRGGLGTAAVLALGIFMFYWVTLVNGEKLADRGLLEPWVGMWGANLIIGLMGLWFAFYISFDLRAVSMRRRIFGSRRTAPTQ